MIETLFFSIISSLLKVVEGKCVTKLLEFMLDGIGGAAGGALGAVLTTP